MSPPITPSRRLSFGTTDVDEDIDVDSEEVDASPKKQRPVIRRLALPAEGDERPAPCVSFGTVDDLVADVEVVSPSPKRGRVSPRKAIQGDGAALDVAPRTPSKLVGSKRRYAAWFLFFCWTSPVSPFCRRESLTPTPTPTPSPP